MTDTQIDRCHFVCKILFNLFVSLMLSSSVWDFHFVQTAASTSVSFWRDLTLVSFLMKLRVDKQNVKEIEFW